MKTKSEELFESFLTANRIQFEKIEEMKAKGAWRPDYRIAAGSAQLIFELKELAEDANFGVVKNPDYPHIKSHSRSVGDHVRRSINGARKQIQFGANQGFPSVLLIYNNIDSVFQAFGTEDMDFVAAMYGEFTMLLDKTARRSVEVVNGKEQLLQENKNTSFSAVGRLSDLEGRTTVTLFDNVYAKAKLPYEHLPPCFLVRRFQVSTAPLSFGEQTKSD